MMKILIYILRVFFAILFLESSCFGELSIHSAQPTFGIVGQHMDVTIQGSGFDENTRAILYQKTIPIISSLDIGGYARHVAAEGSTAYVSAYVEDTDEGFHIVDASDPFHPSVTASLPIYDSRIDIVDGFAYLASPSGGLQIVDVTNPNEPIVLGSIGNYANDVSVVDHIAYMSAGESGLQIIDVTDPRQPEMIAVLEFSNAYFARGIAVANNIAYVISGDSEFSDGNAALKLIDVSDPYSPVLISEKQYSEIGDAKEIDISNGYALIADSRFDLITIDINDPVNPTTRGWLCTSDLEWTTESIEAKGTIAYLCNDYLQVIDVSNHMAPSIIAFAETNSPKGDISNVSWPFLYRPKGVAVSDELIFVADYDAGLTILQASVEVETTVNEQNNQITLSIPKQIVAGSYALRIYNTNEFVDIDDTIKIGEDYPDILISSRTHDFGIVDIGTTSHPYLFNIFNYGDKSVWIRQVSIQSDNDLSSFTMVNDDCSDVELSPDENCSIKIAFSPDTIGEKHATLTLRVGGSHYLSQMSGIGHEIGSYKFKGMWPTLPQPWYFSYPDGLAVDKDGFIYLMDKGSHRVMKFTANGQLVTQWGRQGSNEGEFLFGRTLQFKSGPMAHSDKCDIAADDEGNIYVLDSGNERIQKFDSRGNFITTWGNDTSSEYSMQNPHSLCLDSDNNVWILCAIGILILTPDGEFLDSWEYGTANIPGDIYFKMIRISDSGVVHVGTPEEILRFDIDGNLINRWNIPQYIVEDSRYSGIIVSSLALAGMAVDKEEKIYIASPLTGYVYKYDSEGNEIEKWECFSGYRDVYSNGFTNAFPQYSANILVDPVGDIYIAHERDNFVMKLKSSGEKLSEWGTLSLDKEIQYGQPERIAVSSDNKLYVVDKKYSKVNIYNTAGEYLNFIMYPLDNIALHIKDVAIIDSRYVYILLCDRFNKNYIIKKDMETNQTIEDWYVGEFNDGGIGVDNNGDILLAAGDAGLLVQYSSNGFFIGEVQNPFMKNISDVAVGDGGFIYTVDKESAMVCKLNQIGGLVSFWGGKGPSEFYLEKPVSIDVDPFNRVLIADPVADRVKIFTSNGAFLGVIGDGAGNLPGQLKSPTGVASSPEGDIVYIAESGNHRFQAFQYTNIDKHSKAIIVVGGKSEDEEDIIWESTQMCANFAYRTLVSQGFSKETIYYLSSDVQLDLDHNGEKDDVDGKATLENLEFGLKEWASDADSLVLYLTDHGDKTQFRMNENEILSVFTLDDWLDSAQQNMKGDLIVIYDACESGSFLPFLTTPEGKKRAVIASAAPDTPAYFASQGSVSFSFNFWTHVFHGRSVRESFDLAVASLELPVAFQSPFLDANGNGIENETEDMEIAETIFIGRGNKINGEAPIIGHVEKDTIVNNASSALLSASEVTDSDGIARVWAMIKPPDYHFYSSNNPVLELPHIDLMHLGGDNYEAMYDGFHIEGMYQIAIYAMDKMGNTSIPKLLNVMVNNPLKRKAIIVCAGFPAAESWQVVKQNGALAYEALKYQGYTDEDIYFMSPRTFSPGVDGTPTHNTLEYAVQTWSADLSQDLVIYMIGEGGKGQFYLNENEIIEPFEMNEWLQELQDDLPGAVTIIYDACHAESFISKLIPDVNKRRILIGSTVLDQPVNFIPTPIQNFQTRSSVEGQGGNISFSQFFWKSVLNGSNVNDAFQRAKMAVEYLWRFSSENYSPVLDDNGNGIANDKTDGKIAKNVTIGFGIMLASDDPIIGEVSPAYSLQGETSHIIWAKNVTSTASLESVWAIITVPDQMAECSITDAPVVEMSYNQVAQRYEGEFNGFVDYGNYAISVYARDVEGNISTPGYTEVVQECEVIRGDMDSNGLVDLADAIICLKILIATEEDALLFDEGNRLCVDVNGDGRIGLGEAIYILNYLWQ